MTTPLERILRGARALGCTDARKRIRSPSHLAGGRDRRAAADVRDVLRGRTCLVTGADGFMGSHLTDALVEIGADVTAFVRATSSGALNNIGHLRDRLPRRLRRPDRQDVDRLPDQASCRTRSGQAVRLPPRRPGARGRVVAPAVRDGDGEHDRHAQPAAVGRRLGTRAGEVRHGRHLGGVRQRARERRPSPRFRRRGRADPARALADQPEVDLRDRKGRRRLPDDELPRRLRHPGRRHAHVQQLRAAPEPALRHGHDHHAGPQPAAGSSWARSSRCATSASAPTASAATSPSPRRAFPATSTSTARARTSRWPTGPT